MYRAESAYSAWSKCHSWPRHSWTDLTGLFFFFGLALPCLVVLAIAVCTIVKRLDAVVPPAALTNTCFNVQYCTSGANHAGNGLRADAGASLSLQGYSLLQDALKIRRHPTAQQESLCRHRHARACTRRHSVAARHRAYQAGIPRESAESKRRSQQRPVRHPVTSASCFQIDLTKTQLSQSCLACSARVLLITIHNAHLLAPIRQPEHGSQKPPRVGKDADSRRTPEGTKKLTHHIAGQALIDQDAPRLAHF